MRKDNIPVGISTLVLMIVTITFKLVLIVLGIGILIARPHNIMPYIDPIKGFFYFGLLLNSAFVGFIILFIIDTDLAGKLLKNTIKYVGNRWKVIKTEKLLARVNDVIEKYKDTAYYFKAHKAVIWKVFLMSVIQRMIFFYVTFLVYRSFGLHGTDWLTITVLQGVIAIAVEMLPIPGGVGFSENLFLLVFNPVFGQLTLPAMVVSRGLSYYTELVLSALVTLVAYFTFDD